MNMQYIAYLSLLIEYLTNESWIFLHLGNIVVVAARTCMNVCIIPVWWTLVDVDITDSLDGELFSDLYIKMHQKP